MMTDLAELWLRLAVALGIGLLIGVERERRKGDFPTAARPGLRSFALAAILGAISFHLGGVVLLAVTAALEALLVLLTSFPSRTADQSLTSGISLLLTCLLGALAMREPVLASGIGVTVAALLMARVRLHWLVISNITANELHDVLILAGAALVVLPIMPDRFMGPYHAINPYALWRIVVLMLAISAAGHVTMRVLGVRYGLPLTGLVSGFVSSAMSVSAMGHHARSQPSLLPGAVAGAIPFSGNRPCRSFTVRWRNSGGVQSSYYGLVIQVNAQDDQLQYEPRPRLDKVLELLRSLNPELSEENLRARAARGRDEGGGDGEQDEGEASFDYFGLFQGTWKLRDYYARLQAAGKPVSPFDATSPYSVTTLYRAITLQPALTPEARIGRYIQLAEVNDLLAGFAQAGNIPPEDSPCRDIGAEMDALRAPIRESLAKSKAFRNMFGSHPQQNVDIFLDWFHIEMKQNEMMQNEGMHA
jgi:hypothetical protein